VQVVTHSWLVVGPTRTLRYYVTCLVVTVTCFVVVTWFRCLRCCFTFVVTLPQIYRNVYPQLFRALRCDYWVEHVWTLFLLFVTHIYRFVPRSGFTHIWCITEFVPLVGSLLVFVPGCCVVVGFVVVVCSTLRCLRWVQERHTLFTLLLFAVVVVVC